MSAEGHRRISRRVNSVRHRDRNSREVAVVVRVEKNGAVWTVIHDRPEARNAMDPESADALTAAFLEFDADKEASVAVFYGAGGAFCAGWDLKYVSTLNADYPLGELDISTCAAPWQWRGNSARTLGALSPRAGQAGHCGDRGPCRRRRNGIGAVVRFPSDGERVLLRRLLPPLGRAIDRWRDSAIAANRRPRPRAGNHSDRAKSPGGGMLEHRPVRIRHAQRGRSRESGGTGTGDRTFPAGLRARRSALRNQESRAEHTRALIQEWYNGREA